MSITFTVPLSARVLRAILHDMEGGGECACRATEPVPMTEEQQSEAKRRWLHEVTVGQSITHQQAEQDDDLTAHPVPAPLTSGIVEQGNPFVVAPAPTPTEVAVTREAFAVVKEQLAPFILTPEGVMPVDEVTDPFILTPEGVIPVDEVTDPFVLQTAAPSVPPVPMPPVPMPPVTPAPPTGVPVDSEGLPWDKRIHASTKTKRQSDDTWKLIKGVDKDVVERVKAELRATMSLPVAPAPPTPVVPVAPVVNNYSGAQSGGYTPPVTIVTAPEPPAVPAPPVTPPVPAPPTGMTFSDFVTYATNKIVAKQFSKLQLQEACAAEGITSMPMLENRPDLIPAIHKFLESICVPADSVGGA
jgi:hypothetical protein